MPLQRRIYSLGNRALTRRTQKLAPLLRDEGGVHRADPDADSAFRIAGEVHGYFLRKFGRDSYNNGGRPIDIYLHRGRKAWAEAHHTPEQDFVTLGDAETEEWNAPLACDDVLAHEIAHGYVRYLATLRYGLTEAGAIIEHLCDAFAWFVTREQAPVAAGDWTIGKGFPVGHRALRDLGNPAAADLRIPAAAHRDAMKGIGKQEDLYFNAGVLGKALATIMAAVEQARVDAVAAVWYKLAERLPEAGTFALFRDEAVRAGDEDSADLGGVVRGAFTAVGL